MSADFLLHIRITPKPPCDKGCRHRQRCLDYRLACSHFYNYCSSKKAMKRYRAPSKVLYRELYPEEA